MLADRELGQSTNDEAGQYWQPSDTCWVCGEASTEEPTAYLCAPCKRVLRPNNLTAEQKEARVRHMREQCEQWELHGAFLCSYTGVELDLDVPYSVKYLEWEHATPGHEGSVVLAAALVNRMKCYLDASEFEHMVIALAERFGHKEVPFDESAWPATTEVPRSPQAPE